MSAFILETERLRLRELRDDDLDNLMRILGDARAMEFWPSVMTRAEGAEWIARQRQRCAQDGCGYWACEVRATGEFAGQTGLLATELDGGRELGLGYMFIPGYWGRGYATEIARGCLDYGFRKFPVEQIVVLIRPENEPSLRVAARLQYDLWQTVNYKGYVHRVFRITRREWKARAMAASLAENQSFTFPTPHHD